MRMLNTAITVCIPGSTASSYPIWISSKLLENLSLWMPPCKSKVLIITDDWVQNPYASLLEQRLINAGYHTCLLSFPAGEPSKNRATKHQLEEQMFDQGCDRDTLILAVGGGVVGDLAGFTAATYMRGIAYIQVPTTLLAMLDSSVGGKTGIDTPQGKNLIGAFWQPQAVISDIDCLRTLPQQQFINGLIEAIKIFLTCDLAGLTAVEEQLDLILSLDEDALIKLIRRAVQLKADIVMRDERESNQRAVLNFGHTIGHALEQLTGYQLLHGYAVALGLLVEAKIAQIMGLLQESQYQRIKALLHRLDISSNDLKRFDVDEIIKKTQLDKKRQAGAVRYVLLNDVGAVYEINHQFVHPVQDEMVKMAFLQTIKD